MTLLWGRVDRGREVYKKGGMGEAKVRGKFERGVSFGKDGT